MSEVNLPPDYDYTLCHHCMGEGMLCQTNESLRVFKHSKRIVLAFTDDFNRTAFNNPAFIKVLRDVYRYEPNCVIVAVNFGFDEAIIRAQLLHKIEGPYLYDDKNNPNAERSKYKHSLWTRMKRRVRYECGLNNIEILDYEDEGFYRKFHYIMPKKDGCCSCRYNKDGGFDRADLIHSNRKSVLTSDMIQIEEENRRDAKRSQVYMAGRSEVTDRYWQQSQIGGGKQTVLDLNFDFESNEASGRSSTMKLARDEEEPGEGGRVNKILGMFAPNPNRIIHLDGCAGEAVKISRR